MSLMDERRIQYFTIIVIWPTNLGIANGLLLFDSSLLIMSERSKKARAEENKLY